MHFSLTSDCEFLFIPERTLEQCELNTMSSPSNIAAKHLSKSASELSSPREMPEVRPSSAAPPEITHVSVYQKAHSFISQLKVSTNHFALVRILETNVFWYLK